jgi:DegV family protein with EDD domain
MKIRIITDSTSEITQAEAKEMGIDVAPLHVDINGKDYIDGVTITNKEFFNHLRTAKVLPKTSAVNPAAFMKIFNQYDKEDHILAILVSSGISATLQSADIARKELPDNKITIYDSQQVTLGLCALVHAAVQFRDAGDDVETIVNKLDDIRNRMVLQAAFNDLKYLKMGGRLPAAVAYIGSIIHLKPIIGMKDGRVHMLAKTIGMQRAMNYMVNYLVNSDVDESLPRFLGHSDAPETFDTFKALVAKAKTNFPIQNPKFIGISVGSHAGPGCVGLVYFKKN